MHPFAARRFAKAHEANGFQPVANFARALNYVREINAGRRIEIENQTPWDVGISRLAVPWMQLESGQLRNFRETFHSIDLKVWLLAA
jgi:hypothetical protein